MQRQHRVGFRKKPGMPIYRVFALFIILEDPAALYPSDHDMMP